MTDNEQALLTALRAAQKAADDTILVRDYYQTLNTEKDQKIERLEKTIERLTKILEDKTRKDIESIPFSDPPEEQCTHFLK